MLAGISDHEGMQHALSLAKKAQINGEVPVGAALYLDGQIIGEGYNAPIARHDASAHAEIVALRDAGQQLGNYRLPGTTLYVTLEPCIMCIGAISQARVKRLVYGSDDPKRGAIVSALNLSTLDFLNHRIEVERGVLADHCSQILKDFFQSKRDPKSP